MPRRRNLKRIRIAVLGVALAFCYCGSDPVVRDLGTRAVIIGIDGADWKVIDELIAEGGLPNLRGLYARGTSGPIRTLDDIALSPVIWTSVVTGKTADKHGVAWFMVDQADGKRVPIRSYNRKSKALWNILAEHDRRPIVIGWWATYPAEDVGPGIIVSDGMGYHGFGSTARDGDDAQKIHPALLFERMSTLVPAEHEILPEFARRFIDIDAGEYRREMSDPGRSIRRSAVDPIHLFQEYAVTAQGYTAITEDLLAREPFDLLMVYFEQVDSFSHLFMKYAPPKLEWVEQEGFDRYHNTVRAWYAYQDELLGRLLDRIDLKHTAVFVLSDHGFKSGRRRIRSEHTVDIRRAHLDHETDGIFIAAGPQIRSGGKIEGASVLDITPTVLHYLGFAVARDMDGRILDEILKPEFSRNHPPRFIETYETRDAESVAAAVEVAKDLSDEELAERMMRLRALGYVGNGDSGGAQRAAPTVAAGESSPEIHNNLGQIHLSRGKLDNAQTEFERALALDPNNAEALLNIGKTRRIDGRVAEAEQFVRRAIKVDPNSIHALAQLAEIKRDQNDLDESIRLYREALSIDDSQPFLQLGLGDSLHRAGRHEEAERAFLSVLELDPDSFEAHYNLGVTYLARERLDEAVERFNEALELAPQHRAAGLALNNLGDIQMRRGETEEAAESFRRAVKSSPGHLESRFNLGSLYLSQGKLDEAIEMLEQASALCPDHEHVHSSLGMAYLHKGRNQEAYKSFLLVRRLYPNNWIAPLGLALVHAGSGDQEQARALLEESFLLGGQAAHIEAENYEILGNLLR